MLTDDPLVTRLADNLEAIFARLRRGDDSALADADAVMSVAEKAWGANDLRFVPILGRVGDMYTFRLTPTNKTIAERLYLQQLAIAQLEAPGTVVHAQALNRLLQFRGKLGQNGAAHHAAADVCSIYKSIRCDERHPYVACILVTTALLASLGDANACSATYQLLPLKAVDRKGVPLRSLTQYLRETAENIRASAPVEALRMLDLAERIAATSTDEAQPSSITNELEWATCELDFDREDHAEMRARRALANTEPGTAESAQCLRLLGTALRSRGLPRQAATCYDEAAREAGKAGLASLQAWLLTLSAQATADCGFASELKYRKALEAICVTHGESHETYAHALCGLARVRLAHGDLEEGDELLAKALSIAREAKDASVLAWVLYDRAEFSLRARDVCGAVGMLIEAIAIFRRVGGRKGLAGALIRYAALRARNGDGKEAVALWSEAAAIEHADIDRVLAIASRSERREYLEGWMNVNSLLRAGFDICDTEPAARHPFANLVLRRKALSYEADLAESGALSRDGYRELEPMLQRLREVYAALAAGAPLSGTSDERVLGGPNDELEDERDGLERVLSQSVSEIRLARSLRAISVERIASALTSGAALLEFVSLVERSDVFGNVHPALYLVVIVRRPNLAAAYPGSSADEIATQAAWMVDVRKLSSPDEIDACIRKYRTELVGQRSRDLAGASSDAVDVDVTSKRLRGLVFDPILPALDGITRLHISPDGLLGLVPFDALLFDDGAPACSRFLISNVGTGRDLLRTHEQRPPGASSGPIVFAPTFLPKADVTPSRAADASELGDQSASARAIALSALPGAGAEGRAIAEITGAELYVGHEATSERLKSIRRPILLHLATHGFAMAVNDELGDDSARGTDPMLNCGLILANASARSPREASTGSILLAREVSGLDMRGTELVVLSACETGIGNIAASEGMFSLRRSFLLAGAKAVVASLWKVPDEPTRHLMIEFYRALASGVSLEEALQGAKMDTRLRYPAQVNWAGFVLDGVGGPVAFSSSSIAKRQSDGDQGGRNEGSVRPNTRVFPQLDAPFYRGEPSTRAVSTEGERLLHTARNLPKIQLLRPLASWSPEELVAQVLALHRSAFSAEQTHSYRKADFYFVQCVWFVEDHWCRVVQQLPMAHAALALVDELLIETHAAYAWNYARRASADVSDMTSARRAYIHFIGLNRLLKYSRLSVPEVDALIYDTAGLVADSLALKDCDGDAQRAAEVMLLALDRFPSDDFVHEQAMLFTCMAAGTSPKARALSVAAHRLERIHRRNPYRASNFQLLTLTYHHAASRYCASGSREEWATGEYYAGRACALQPDIRTAEKKKIDDRAMAGLSLKTFDAVLAREDGRGALTEVICTGITLWKILGLGAEPELRTIVLFVLAVRKALAKARKGLTPLEAWRAVALRYSELACLNHRAVSAYITYRVWPEEASRCSRRVGRNHAYPALLEGASVQLSGTPLWHWLLSVALAWWLSPRRMWGKWRRSSERS